MKPNKFLKSQSGIYGIRNILNNKIYVGRTNDFYKRCKQYLYDYEFRRIGHINDYLYRSFVKYGIDNFEFFVLEFCNVAKCPERELHYIDFYASCNRNKGYNLRRDVNGIMQTAPETSEKIRNNLKRQWSNGLRKNHGVKLALSWDKSPDRKFQQSTLLKTILTKYKYIVTNPQGQIFNCDYSQLLSMGLGSVLSAFHRKNKDDVICKNHRVIRVKVLKNEL